MEERKIKEREFHDKQRLVSDDVHVRDTRWSLEIEPTISNNPLWANMKYYSVERRSRDRVCSWLRENCGGKVVLDYCCGNGGDALFIASQCQSRVFGIDLSEVSIVNCQQIAHESGLSDKTTFLVRDAENTGFEDNTFDIITEYGALHHLDLDSAYAEMARILRPGGKAICNETLGHNPLIHLYRRLTPRLRTEWEVNHILRMKHINLAKKYFERVEADYYHLLVLAAVPLRKTRVFPKILALLERLDERILNLPGIRLMAWQTVFVLSNPRGKA